MGWEHKTKQIQKMTSKESKQTRQTDRQKRNKTRKARGGGEREKPDKTGEGDGTGYRNIKLWQQVYQVMVSGPWGNGKSRLPSY